MPSRSPLPSPSVKRDIMVKIVRSAVLPFTILLGIAVGCKRGPERPLDPEPYLRLVQRKLAAMGLPWGPDGARSAKIHRGLAESSPTGRSTVKVRMEEYTFVFEEATQRVVFFSDWTAHQETVDEYERLKSSLGFDEAEYEKSQMTEEEVVRMVEQSGYLALFNGDVKGLELKRVAGRFHGHVYHRGWDIGYKRHYGGYGFTDEFVWFGVDDRRRKIVTYSYHISPGNPPPPKIAIPKEKVPGIVERWVSGSGIGARMMRDEGYVFKGSTLVVEPEPQYLHANFAFSGKRLPWYSMTNPLRLAYICHFDLEKKDPEPSKKQTLHMQIWFSADTGEMVGGDARSTIVINDSERIAQ
jgi:hypothetical protein